MTTVFSHAVASFEPTATAVLIWTRLTGADRARWQVARDPGFSDVVAEGETATEADRDHTVVVDVGDLAPATTYWYRFDAGGHRSPVGRTRTLPEGPVDHARIGLVSCARYSVAPLGVYRALAEREVDFVLHLGDYFYEDGKESGDRPHRPTHACVTVEDYRERIGQMREDPDCQAIHLRHPMILMIDDHDVADNCWQTGAKKHDEAESGPWKDRVHAALQARQEWAPSRLRDPAEPTATWRSVLVGDLAEMVILETRLAGRDEQAGDGKMALHDPDRSLLGHDQRRWLAERTADVTRPWLLVGTGVVLNQVSLPLPVAAGRLLKPLLPNGYAAVDGKILHDDQWDGYPAERDRLVEALAARGKAGGRAVVLSGDIHSSWAFEGPCAPDGTPVAVEFTTPAVSSHPMGHSRAPGAWRLLDGLVNSLEHVPWVDVTARGYGILDVTADDIRMSWWFVRATDKDPASTVKLAACFAVSRHAWPPRLEEAEPRPDPYRPGMAEPLPGRPADLTALRRAHHIRQAVSRLTGTLAPAVLVFAAARLVLGRRGHR
jgi:alkaline phosphatase D